MLRLFPIKLDRLGCNEELVRFTLLKAKFFDRNLEQLNERQLKVINRMFENVDGFKGGTSKASATRDLQHLQEIGVFIQKDVGSLSGCT